MKRKSIFLLLLFSMVYSPLLFLTACSPLEQQPDGDRRGDDREGEPAEQLPEDVTEGLTWLEILRNCKPEVDTPDNIIDIGLSVLPEKWRELYLPSSMRSCLKAKLEEAQGRICKSREELERRRRRAKTASERAAVENSLYRLDQIQFKFNQKLNEMAVNLDDELIKLERKEANQRNDFGRFLNWVGQEETQALRDIFDTESYSECTFYSDDD